MTRHFGLPPREGERGFGRARQARPVATLVLSALFGILAAALATMSFADASGRYATIFHGPSLAAAIVSAGFGCWGYIWIARPRFAAHFRPAGDAFIDLARFFGKAGVALLIAFAVGRYGAPALGGGATGLMLCAVGGAAAAAAFQTVLAFVPAYEPDAGR
ncbi:MAG: hypothetical protein AAGC56_03320 [Pseudomonadota bacterium]